MSPCLISRPWSTNLGFGIDCDSQCLNCAFEKFLGFVGICFDSIEIIWVHWAGKRIVFALHLCSSEENFKFVQYKNLLSSHETSFQNCFFLSQNLVPGSGYSNCPSLNWEPHPSYPFVDGVGDWVFRRFPPLVPNTTAPDLHRYVLW